MIGKFEGVRFYSDWCFQDVRVLSALIYTYNARSMLDDLISAKLILRTSSNTLVYWCIEKALEEAEALEKEAKIQEATETQDIVAHLLAKR